MFVLKSCAIFWYLCNLLWNFVCYRNLNDYYQNTMLLHCWRIGYQVLSVAEMLILFGIGVFAAAQNRDCSFISASESNIFTNSQNCFNISFGPEMLSFPGRLGPKKSDSLSGSQSQCTIEKDKKAEAQDQEGSYQFLTCTAAGSWPCTKLR